MWSCYLGMRYVKEWCVCRYDVQGIPKLILFSKDNKDGEGYGGALDLEGLVSFINEKCGTSRDEEGQLTSNVSIFLL